jgi:nucleoside-diphosphate-sugar epimerase
MYEQVLGLALDDESDWSGALKDVTTVIHCAARAHILRDKSNNPLLEYRRVNVDGTLRLAHQAAAAGVRRFIFISSIKVNGEKTELGCPFTADDVPNPTDPYGISKWEAERALLELAKQTTMEVVIIRPPLIYGPGVKANFSTLVRLVNSKVPLPLGLLNKNRRSFVGLENLLSFIRLCMEHPGAANQTFLISDNHDMSTVELLENLSSALGVQLYLIKCPIWILRILAKVFGKTKMIERVIDSLEVDITKSIMRLGWSPVANAQEGLKSLIGKVNS